MSRKKVPAGRRGAGKKQPHAAARRRPKVIRCSLCKRRLRKSTKGWLVHVRAKTAEVYEYACPDCQSPNMLAQAQEWPPATTMTVNTIQGAKTMAFLSVGEPH